MVLPKPPEPEVEIYKAVAKPTTSNSITFSGITAIPKFYAMIKEGSNTAISGVASWVVFYQNSDKYCYMTSTSSSSNVSAIYSTGYAVSINNGLNISGISMVSADNYDLFYTDGEIKTKTVLLASANMILNFSDVQAEDTSKFLLLVQTSASSAVANRPASWARFENTITQTRGYSSSSQSTVSLRTTTSANEIIEGYDTGLKFTRSLGFPVGNYTIYYA